MSHGIVNVSVVQHVIQALRVKDLHQKMKNHIVQIVMVKCLQRDVQHVLNPLLELGVQNLFLLKIEVGIMIALHVHNVQLLSLEKVLSLIVLIFCKFFFIIIIN